MTVRYGLVGCGAISRTHADALIGAENARLESVFDVVPDRSMVLAQSHGCHQSQSLAELFDHCDAAIVCVPSGLHAEIGKLAAQAGKHVLVEKPIDTTLEKAMSLVLACEAAKVKLGVISQHRFANSIQEVRRAAQSGELGNLLAGDAYIKWYRTQAYYDSGDWRGTIDLDGGGCLINQSIHMIDMIQWIMGGVQSVQAQIRTTSHDMEGEDVAQVLVNYKNGATGLIYGSTSFYPGLPERLEVHGKHGTVIVEADRLKMWKSDPIAAGKGLYGSGVMAQPTPLEHSSQEQESRLIERFQGDPSANWGEQHRLQLEDFTNAIIEDRQPFISGHDALAPLRVILGVYESARNGGQSTHIS